jgi:2-iminoacetate synthase ThiH
MAKSSTTFSKSNQPATGRGKSERTKILEAMERASESEDSFYDLLMAKAFNPEDNFTFKELLNRISPIPKSVSPMVEFDFDPKAKPHEQAMQALEAVAIGKIPADLAHMFVTSISSMLNIQEKTDFEERLKAIEDASEQN